jgi:hypothetical protein
MRTEVITTRLPLHEATLISRQAAERGIAKSQHAANLIVRGLDADARDLLPLAVERLERIAERSDELLRTLTAHRQRQLQSREAAQLELRAFMIEVLTLLRYLFKDDLKIKGEVGRRLQKAVGDIRVDGV